jgi:hypothetical protein
MEDTARVVRLSEPTEISESRIKLGEVIRGAEDFCPVRPWLEGLKRGFDLWTTAATPAASGCQVKWIPKTLRWHAELSQSSSAGRLLGHS